VKEHAANKQQHAPCSARKILPHRPVDFGYSSVERLGVTGGGFHDYSESL
jgi:hypothetical protein